MSKVEQMETELRKLSPTELQQLRDWLEDYFEDRLEITGQFAASIERGKKDIAEGNVRVRDLEDMGDLETAIAENAGKPLVSWEQAKSEFDLEFTPEFEQSIQQAERDMAEGNSVRIREPGVS